MCPSAIIGIIIGIIVHIFLFMTATNKHLKFVHQNMILYTITGFYLIAGLIGFIMNDPILLGLFLGVFIGQFALVVIIYVKGK